MYGTLTLTVLYFLHYLDTVLHDTYLQIVAHSMGAWFAYEFLCHARASGLPMPLKVFLSAMPHPALPLNQRPWKQQSSLDEAEFQVKHMQPLA